MTPETAPAGRRAFVTGATGFVGGNLAGTLAATGWQVTALCRTPAQAEQLRRAALSPAMGDLTDADSVKRAMPENVDAVFHVAGDVSFWSRHDARQTAVNVNGTANVVAAALAKRARRFIHTSSCSAFGRHAQRMSEATQSNAATSSINYERSKWLGEQEVRRGAAAGLNATIINPCAIMGPGDTSGWAQFFTQIRDGRLKVVPPGIATFNHVRDVVAAHIAAVDRGAPGENYLLPGEEASFATLTSLMAQAMGLPFTPRTAPQWLLRAAGSMAVFASGITGRQPQMTPELATVLSATVLCDTGKAAAALGYRYTPLKICISDSLAWLRAQRLV